MAEFETTGASKSGRREHEEKAYLMEKPVREGAEYDVTIEEVGARGDGFTRVQNFVIFVPGTSKGELVHIRVNKVRAKCAFAERVEGKTAATTTD